MPVYSDDILGSNLKGADRLLPVSCSAIDDDLFLFTRLLSDRGLLSGQCGAQLGEQHQTDGMLCVRDVCPCHNYLRVMCRTECTRAPYVSLLSAAEQCIDWVSRSMAPSESHLTTQRTAICYTSKGVDDETSSIQQMGCRWLDGIRLGNCNLQ